MSIWWRFLLYEPWYKYKSCERIFSRDDDFGEPTGGLFGGLWKKRKIVETIRANSYDPNNVFFVDNDTNNTEQVQKISGVHVIHKDTKIKKTSFQDIIEEIEKNSGDLILFEIYFWFQFYDKFESITTFPSNLKVLNQISKTVTDFLSFLAFQFL